MCSKELQHFGELSLFEAIDHKRNNCGAILWLSDRQKGAWMRKKAGKEVVTIQILRAVAAVWVIFAHLSSDSHPFWRIGVVGVDIFFALSGFVMVLSTNTLRERPNAALIFLRRRFIRIVPMYWLVSALFLLYCWHTSHHLFQFNYIVHSFLLIPFRSGAPSLHYFPILTVGWTLTYEFFFYLCFALCLALRISPFYLAPVFLGLSIVGFRHGIQPVAIFSIFNYLLLEFLAGMAIAWLYQRRIFLPWKYAVIICLLCIGCFVRWPILSERIHMIVWSPASIIFIYAALSLEPFLARHMPRTIEILADASYSIYLCHQGLVLTVISDHYRKLNTAGYFSNLMEVVLCCVVGVGMHYSVERPMLARFNVWIGGHPPS